MSDKMSKLKQPKPVALLAAPVNYTYHVVYQYAKKAEQGSGTIQITRNYPINSSAQIESVSEYIRNLNNFTKVMLVNWILL